MATAAKPNRLIHEPSLYLRKHAYNPVDWWPWSAEARQLARELDRPVFLSIGYSSCHWCTVMEHEAFCDPMIAQYLNDHYIPIKVDREERPDIDSIYMQALQLMQEQGGWPLNIFLTPDDLVPFYGGTYFPVAPRYGRPGFLQVLEFLYTYYKQEKTELNARQTRLMDTLSAVTRLGTGRSLDREWVRQGVRQVQPVLNPTGPNFPMIPYADLLLRASRYPWREQKDLEEATRDRGLDLALGGIFDHVGGGFHRYTVDHTWTVPHFEKMLYDNGQILEYLADLWSCGVREPAFERAVDLTVQWLDREMTAPQGYFYASQDADSEGEEGKCYVWSLLELTQALGSEAVARLQEVFTLSEAGNFAAGEAGAVRGTNVLQRRAGGVLSPEVTEALEKLFRIRQKRIPPATDTKMILAWNSLQISGLCRAADAFDRPEYRQRAVRCAQFLLDHQGVDGPLCRVNYDGTPMVAATAEDYALWVRALLDLFEGTQDTSWLLAAQRIQAEMDERLGDVEQGGYFSSSAAYTGTNARAGELILREKDYQDNATPAANGTAAQNLLRLFALTDRTDYLTQAERTILAFAPVLDQAPRACPSLLSAVDGYWNLSLVQTFTDTGAPLLKRLLAQYHPTVVYKAILRPEDTEQAVGLVCKGTTCLTPARSVAELEGQLQEVTTRVG
ncbi:thioredoxin domain-containing protein [Anthocerotibacter panamensis]|uniref:thioredoxin domain-containing protein n=1 Tax=Anthocerotibacter panamensis TaxID=2857077 RepID=UPI001C408067|nr:thioredoxin domain-containing protein [Anthocerotibacter panamensis]